MKLLPINILLTLAICRLTSSETVGPTLMPLTSASALPTNSKRVHLTGKNKVENVELLNPANLSLECIWTGNQNKQPNITGFWRKGGEEIQDSRVPVAPENQQYRLQRVFNIVSEEHLGNYTCVFENEAELDFILAVPRIGEKREKPIVSYVGDFVVLTCKMEETKPVPRTWNWFKINGTDKEQLFEAQRYDITVIGHKTKLKVKDVSEADSGVYHCAAVYNISTSTSKLHLKVITIWEPLKPFLGILVEVVILVTVILIYERSHSKKKEAEANGLNADPKNTQPQGEDEEAEERTSVRQRKT
ncbi:embigin [Poecilia latipinna]|uniref:embigin n=1 Tax=Poecilia latipinna TaxID=48699 RepID=UPI00072DF4D6|nr:PREDICTED: embigin [Poecilia latipinna]